MIASTWVHSTPVQIFGGVDWRGTGTTGPMKTCQPQEGQPGKPPEFFCQNFSAKNGGSSPLRVRRRAGGAESLQLFGSFWAPCGPFLSKNDEKSTSLTSHVLL